MCPSPQPTLLPVKSSEDEEFTSIPDLETPREQLSPVQENPEKPDHGAMIVPADAHADIDHFEDTDRQDNLRQHLEKEINEAPWHKDVSQKALEGMEKLLRLSSQHMKAFGAKMIDMINRLDEVAKKLKDRCARKK